MRKIKITYDYHIGLIKSGDTVIIQLRQNKDFLDCELWQYLGIRECTKKQVYTNRKAFLLWINGQFNKDFKHVRID